MGTPLLVNILKKDGHHCALTNTSKYNFAFLTPTTTTAAGNARKLSCVLKQAS